MKRNLKLQIIGGIVIVFIFFIFLVSKSAKTVPTAEQSSTANIPQSQATQAPEIKAPDYQILKTDEQKTVTNYSVLVSPGTDGKAVAEDVKKKCTKQCNISVYDDKQAYFKYLEYDLMMGSLDTPPESLTAWKKNNYVYVADHLIGDVTFDSGEYNDYPFRDWYYKELKGE